MDKNVPDEQLIWMLIDGELSAEQKKQVEDLIENEPAWKACYNSLSQLDSLMATVDTEQPSMRFTQNVMDEIANHSVAPSSKSYVNKKVILTIAVFLGFALAASIVGIISLLSVSANGGGNLTLAKWDFASFPAGACLNAMILLNLLFGYLWIAQYLHLKKTVVESK